MATRRGTTATIHRCKVVFLQLATRANATLETLASYPRGVSLTKTLTQRGRIITDTYLRQMGTSEGMGTTMSLDKVIKGRDQVTNTRRNVVNQSLGQEQLLLSTIFINHHTIATLTVCPKLLDPGQTGHKFETVPWPKSHSCSSGVRVGSVLSRSVRMGFVSLFLLL